MTISYTEALSWLGENPNATLGQLQDLVSRTSAGVDGVALLYSNDVSGQPMWKVANSIESASNGQVSTIVSTEFISN
jgi:hypothetical protein